MTLALSCAIAQAQLAAPGQKAAKAPDGATQSQVRARALLMEMAKHLASAQRFSVSVRSDYDAVQPSGEKIAFGEVRKVTVSRPGRLRVEGERSDGARVLTAFTGKEIVLVDLESKVYATAPQPGDLDRAVTHFVGDLGIRLPLAALLLSSLPAALEQRVQSIDYVERTSMYGTPAHHLAARTATVDFQIWILEGERPLIQRVVITYKLSRDRPQYRAALSDWNFAPDVSDAVFALKPPDGAQKVAFAAQLPRRTLAARAVKADKGSK
ncbi:MAG TPA: DUF2092 domain-containing protein [Burkholderiales bacterium]|nr:DUF2092 domain-containing protein [Burkholderiales bacterium]